MSEPKDPFASIDPAALAQVSGGATASQNPGSDGVDLYGALSGILDSLNDLSSSRSSGSGFSTTEMLMLMYVMEQRNRGPTVIAAPPPMPYYVVRR